VAETVNARCRTRGQKIVAEVDVTGSDSEDEDDEVEGEDNRARPTFGSIRMINEEMVIETSDFEETVNDYISMLEAKQEGASESAEETDSEDEAEGFEEDS
jgi:hypothetical protein